MALWVGYQKVWIRLLNPLTSNDISIAKYMLLIASAYVKLLTDLKNPDKGLFILQHKDNEIFKKKIYQTLQKPWKTILKIELYEYKTFCTKIIEK